MKGRKIKEVVDKGCLVQQFEAYFPLSKPRFLLANAIGRNHMW